MDLPRAGGGLVGLRRRGIRCTRVVDARDAPHRCRHAERSGARALRTASREPIMRPMNGLGALAVAALTAWTFLGPAVGSWAFVAVEFAAHAWLTREMRRTDAGTLSA